MKESTYDQLMGLLHSAPKGADEISIEAFIILMFASLVFSFLAARLYMNYLDPHRTGSQIHKAFPLLGIAITALFLCIQFSLPLSLGLLGALSIIRFRTPIKEPEEIAFIMVVVAMSIAIATFNILFALLLLGFTWLTLKYLQRKPEWQQVGAELPTMTIEQQQPLAEVLDAIKAAALADQGKLTLLAASERDGASQLQYSLDRAADPSALLGEVKTALPAANVSLFGLGR